jgi:hypothetical protein
VVDTPAGACRRVGLRAAAAGGGSLAGTGRVDLPAVGGGSLAGTGRVAEEARRIATADIPDLAGWGRYARRWIP